MSITNIPGIKEQVDALVAKVTAEGAGFEVRYLRSIGQFPSRCLDDHLWLEHSRLYPTLEEAERDVRELADQGARCIRIIARRAA